MSELRSNRYYPHHYYKFQCFVNDETIKDILKLRFCTISEGDTSIVIVVPKRSIESFMNLVVKYNIMVAAKEVSEHKKRDIKLIEKITDTVDLESHFNKL